MADMIDREELKKAVDTCDRFYYVPLQGVKRGSNDDYTALVRINDILHCIDTMPAADVQPIQHGRWLSHHAIWIDQPKIEGWFVQAKCSECEKWAHVMNPYTKSVDYEYCPHCGARMDLKEGDEE